MLLQDLAAVLYVTEDMMAITMDSRKRNVSIVPMDVLLERCPHVAIEKLVTTEDGNYLKFQLERETASHIASNRLDLAESVGSSACKS